MSILPQDSIRVIAESLNIGDISEEIATNVASDVEYRIREITQEAIKFMKHAKRSKLSTQDIDHALRLRNVEPLYGFSSTQPLNFLRVVGFNDVFVTDDKELDFSTIIAANLPPCPRAPRVVPHWLAVEGVQPEIPENPPRAYIDAQTAAEESEALTGKKRKASAVRDQEEAEDTAPDVKPLVKHTLSKELQLYFTKVTQAIKGDDEKLKSAVLNSLSNDPGLHQLLPYLTQFIIVEVTDNLKNLPMLETLMRMTKSLVHSRHLNIEPYLHQLLPAVLTCLVGSRLCKHPNENHWHLRDMAASILRVFCTRFGAAYASLQPRVATQLLQAFLDPSHPLTTHYGAIVGLNALGPQVVNMLLIPNVETYMAVLNRVLEPPEKKDGEEEAHRDPRFYDATHVRDALVSTIGNLLHAIVVENRLPPLEPEGLQQAPSIKDGPEEDAPEGAAAEAGAHSLEGPTPGGEVRVRGEQRDANAQDRVAPKEKKEKKGDKKATPPRGHDGNHRYSQTADFRRAPEFPLFTDVHMRVIALFGGRLEPYLHSEGATGEWAGLGGGAS